MGGGRAPAHRVPHLVRGADPDYRRHARRRGFLVWCWAATTFHGGGSGRRSLPGDGSQGGGNDVVAATMSSGARRCGNDVVGRIARGGSGGDGEAGVAGRGLALTPKEQRWSRLERLAPEEGVAPEEVAAVADAGQCVYGCRAGLAPAVVWIHDRGAGFAPGGGGGVE